MHLAVVVLCEKFCYLQDDGVTALLLADMRRVLQIDAVPLLLCDDERVGMRYRDRHIAGGSATAHSTQNQQQYDSDNEGDYMSAAALHYLFVRRFTVPPIWFVESIHCPSCMWFHSFQ